MPALAKASGWGARIDRKMVVDQVEALIDEGLVRCILPPPETEPVKVVDLTRYTLVEKPAAADAGAAEPGSADAAAAPPPGDAAPGDRDPAQGGGAPSSAPPAGAATPTSGTEGEPPVR